MKVTLEQWRTLISVVEEGTYAKAAERLFKSQSTLSYAIARLEESLGLKVFVVEGRKAILTAEGVVLERRARQLLAQAESIERLASHLAQGQEPLIRIAVDSAFPPDYLYQALAAFSIEYPDIRVELHETVLSGTDDLLRDKKVDLGIAAQLPPGLLGDVLVNLEFVCVAHPAHPLNQIEGNVSYEDLKQHRQVVIRDSGASRKRDIGWLEAEQRITVSNASNSIAALKRGLGFAWMVRQHIESELLRSELQTINLEYGARRQSALYLIYTSPDSCGEATHYLAQQLREIAADQ